VQVHDRSATIFEQQPGRQFSVCVVIGQSGIEVTRFTRGQQMKRSGIQSFEWSTASYGFQVRYTALIMVLWLCYWLVLMPAGIDVSIYLGFATGFDIKNGCTTDFECHCHADVFFLTLCIALPSIIYNCGAATDTIFGGYTV
jgi:hypothetical protein